MELAAYIRMKKAKEVKERDNSIRALYRQGYSMNEIVRWKHVSKHTVFNAIHRKNKGRKLKHKKHAK